MRRPRLPAVRPDLVVLRLVLLGALACAPAPEAEQAPRSTLFVGVDVSGSFQNDGRYDDAMAFAARYINGHLNGHGGLERPRALFVGAIGGEVPGQTQAFHPIHDFQGKTVDEIEADLRAWFPSNDQFTDFNAFFQRAATLVKRQNLALAPVTLVLLSDGVPDLGPAGTGDDPAARYRTIDLDPLEYLARNVTVRILYPDPDVAVRWERDIPRNRVRMWTVDAVVMNGWRAQLADADTARPAGADGAEPDGAEADGEANDAEPTHAGVADAADVAAGIAREVVAGQDDLWAWIRDNVDFRVRRSVF